MSKSRREFIVSSAALLGAGAGASKSATRRATKRPATAGSLPSGSPPVFGTANGVGPEVTAGTFAEAEKLMRVQMSAKDRAEAAESWRASMAPIYERRTGPQRRVRLSRS